MTQTTLEERISIVQRTREVAALTLLDVISPKSEGLSERTICDHWIDALSQIPSLYPEGWYQPPPKGTSILIGNPANSFARLSYDSLRNPDSWSRDDIILRNDSLVYAYASPIDRDTGLIGDIGLTLYCGIDPSIRRHLSECLEMTLRIARFAEVGMELKDIFNYAQRQLKAAHLSNQASSFGTGMANIGHTIPWTYQEYSDEARQCLKRQNMQDTQQLIRKERVFINSQAALRIQPTMAFTIEPQIRSSKDPVCSYHIIVTFIDGIKHITSSFGTLFKAFAMDDYM